MISEPLGDYFRDRLGVEVAEVLRQHALAALVLQGGTPAEAIELAKYAVITLVSKIGGYCHEPDEAALLPFLLQASERHATTCRERIAERILQGERGWVRIGPSRCWHKVATPTRAICGTKILDGQAAWVMVEVPESDQIDQRFRPMPPPLCSRCKAPSAPTF